MRRTLRGVSIVAIMLFAAVGCRSVTGQSLGQNIDDRATTGAVKARLAKSNLKTLTRVDVDTVNGVVYLQGVAPDEATKQMATQIARSQDGVRQVVNQIQVETPAQVYGTNASSTTAARGAQPSAARSAQPSASPATTFSGARNTVSGYISDIDSNGTVTVNTGHGTVDLPFSPSAISGLRKGQYVTIDLGMHPAQR
jgi:BON domain